MAYFSFNGNLDTCITIRTALLKDGKAYVQAGGGWVNDSEPEAEFRETVNQSKAMLKAAALAETFGSVESGRKVWRPRFICSNGKPPGRLNKQSRANGYSVR